MPAPKWAASRWTWEAFASRAGYTVAGVFREIGSGVRVDRSERRKVLALAQRRGIDAVLVTELSRWGRSALDLLHTLRELEARRVSVIAMGGPAFDLSTPHGRMEMVWEDHENALFRVGVDRGCPFDLHTLVPVPWPILRLGPDHPSAIDWMWTHWGTTWHLRRVEAHLLAARALGSSGYRWRIRRLSQAAMRRTKREVRVAARGLPRSQASRRTTLSAAAVARCCRWVLARPT